MLQLEDRRSQLERYLQLSCQDPRILHGVTLNGFLLGAQQETGLASASQSPAEQHMRGEVTLDVHLMNEHKIAVRGAAVLQTDEVLEVGSIILLMDLQSIIYVLF